MHSTFYLSKHSTTHSPRVCRDSESGFSYMPLLAILAIMFIATGLYMTIGRPDLAVESEQTQAAQPAPRANTGQDASVATVESLLTGLEQKLQREPEDGKGWLLLAKSYDHLGRTAEAIEAYARASELGNSDLLLESRLVITAFEAEPPAE